MDLFPVSDSERLRLLLEDAGLSLPPGDALTVLDLGAEERCPAGFRLTCEDFERVLGGARLILRALEQTRAVIALGECYREAFRPFRRLLPKGEISFLCYERTGPETSAEVLSRKLGPIRLLTPQCCRAAFAAFYEDERWQSRRFSVSRGAELQLIDLPFGASARDALTLAAFEEEPCSLMVAGSLLTGQAVTDPDAPLPDEADALTLFTERELHRRFDGRCLRCGSCLRSCPAGLPVFRLAAGKPLDLTDCTDCGTCTYVCPAALPLSTLIARAREEAAIHE